jgi:riboflavin synthase
MPGSGLWAGRLWANRWFERGGLSVFTGMIEALAEVVRVESEPPGCRLVIREPSLAGETRVGESIAVNGCCLTVVSADAEELSFQAGQETLSRTNLGRLAPGSWVNLERSLRLGDRLGGHWVTGHVDGVGFLLERTDAGEWSTCWFRAPQRLMAQMASKGSIAVDGVSLTLVDVIGDRFSVALIPHTLAVTTLGRLREGMAVHLETDVLAKYVERQLDAR